MSDEPHRPDGPIGWLLGWFRTDPVGALLAILAGAVMMYIVFILIVGILEFLGIIQFLPTIQLYLTIAPRMAQPPLRLSPACRDKNRVHPRSSCAERGRAG